MTPALTIETIQAENSYRHGQNRRSLAKHSELRSLTDRRRHNVARTRPTLRNLVRSATLTFRSV
jgi:hypothetical protein